MSTLKGHFPERESFFNSDCCSLLLSGLSIVALKDAKALLEESDGSGAAPKDDDSLLNPGTHSSILDEPSSLDLASEVAYM